MPINEAALQEWLRQTLPLYEVLGLTVESTQNGVYRCRVPLNRQNGNHLNSVHAAVQWAAAEVLGAFAVMDLFGADQMQKMYAVVRSVSIEFHRPAHTDIIVEASLAAGEATEAQRLFAAGKEANFQLHAVVRDEAGETVATTDAHYAVRPPRASRREVQAASLPA
jgi:acyl-coenzyme A thioesterase PaaI-like protein